MLDGTWLSLYSRELLAEDVSVTDDGAGFSEVIVAHSAS